MQFFVIPRSQRFPAAGQDCVFLKIDHWNDFSFVTMFEVELFDERGVSHSLGTVKIGFAGQTTAVDTYTTLESPFTELPPGYFSLGQDESYYRYLHDGVSQDTRVVFLSALRDVVFSQEHQATASGESVFTTSLLRSVSSTAMEGQFRRILGGGVPLTDFDFVFVRPASEKIAGVELEFRVNANSTPSSNIHALIGRNGVGKTRLLNDMITAIIAPDGTQSRFYAEDIFERSPIGPTYFSSLASVAFSAFDPFVPPQEQPNPEDGTRYFYVGLKDIADDTGTLLKSLSTLREECVTSVMECLAEPGRRARWRTAIVTLGSDENFAQMDLGSLVSDRDDNRADRVWGLVERMSSGHAIVLLTISRLVAKVEEKTLVLLDEPESHLHPPLLSAFTRALSQLLHNRNGVAIIATHSPVVLQEVPKACAWVVNRAELAMHAERPRLETFGENVGVLTSEVFGLEVIKSGFHSLLREAVDRGGSYDDIVAEYEGQIGQEARGILRAMITDRNEGGGVR